MSLVFSEGMELHELNVALPGMHSVTTNARLLVSAPN